MEVDKKRIMALTDVAIVFGIIIFFGYLILAKLKQSNHPLVPMIKQWFAERKEKVKPEINPKQAMESWKEKRSIL